MICLRMVTKANMIKKQAGIGRPRSFVTRQRMQTGHLSFKSLGSMSVYFLPNLSASTQKQRARAVAYRHHAEMNKLKKRRDINRIPEAGCLRA